MNNSCEITNMIMVEDTESGFVLVQKRELYWKGIAFPGGHIEDGESFYDSAVREAKEETGLDITDLKLCGTVHWFNTDTKERYMVLLYKTVHFSGKLITKTDEGEVFWVKKEDVKKMNTSPNFDIYLDVFYNDGITEAFACWSDKSEDKLILK